MIVKNRGRVTCVRCGESKFLWATKRNFDNVWARHPSLYLHEKFAVPITHKDNLGKDVVLYYCYDEEICHELTEDQRLMDRELEYMDFADPTGRSVLRAETPTNPRIYPCPTCGRENLLTLHDNELGYQCDVCADRCEAGLENYE